MSHIYFDFAAATPLDPRVKKAMDPYWSTVFGNPGSLHWFGQQASQGVFDARRRIARMLGCAPEEIIFTGSATEANNLAIRGVIKHFRSTTKHPKIIISTIEHSSVEDTCKDLEREGVVVIRIPVSHEGIVDIKKIAEVIDEDTILVSIIAASNEIGTIQPIMEISKIIRNFREVESKKKKSNMARSTFNFPLFHTDAVQLFNYGDCRIETLGVDLLTLSAQKIYGPKGIGLLYRKMGVGIEPLIIGGNREYGLRAGTENVPYIIGCARAMEIADAMREKEIVRLRSLQAYFLKTVQKAMPKAVLNGSLRDRLPNNINLFMPGKSAHTVITDCDIKGFAIAASSACMARTAQLSRIVQALGYGDARAKESIRITFGRTTTKKDIDKLINVLKNI
ncbi:MAG: cysteine desulfurase family protein [bacterium]|nr:cysteine desulfurase family protein [bacterium]